MLLSGPDSRCKYVLTAAVLACIGPTGDWATQVKVGGQSGPLRETVSKETTE